MKIKTNEFGDFILELNYEETGLLRKAAKAMEYSVEQVMQEKLEESFRVMRQYFAEIKSHIPACGDNSKDCKFDNTPTCWQCTSTVPMDDCVVEVVVDDTIGQPPYNPVTVKNVLDQLGCGLGKF